jgi:ABC-2 type transport system permease protein
VWAMIVKEFRQLRRDRRTLAMMIVMPVLLLVVLGYAASFDVKTISVAAAGPQAQAAGALLHRPFDVIEAAPEQGRTWAQDELRDGKADVAVVTGGARPVVLIDGSQLFAARAALTALASLEQRAGSTGGTGPVAATGAAGASGSAGAIGAAGLARPAPQVSILYNPDLKTSDIMIPGIAGVILVFIGTIITSLGVVRERQSGTLEQLAVMPLRTRDVYLGKILPYFAVATVDLAIVIGVGIAIFGVPFRGSPLVFALGALEFLFVTLGLGVLISSVSQNQGQAIQLAIMTLLPQVLLSGLIFPLSSIVVGVRWIAYLLPLTYFNQISRGVMLKAEPIAALWPSFAYLAVLGAVIVTLATLRFRAFLAPAPSSRRQHRPTGPAGAQRPALAGGGPRDPA